MTVRNDRWIRRMSEEHGMIEPFHGSQVREGTISFGVSSYGYDIRVAPEFKVFTNVHNVVVDPKVFDERSFVDVNADHCIIPPNSFALARSMEFFRIPRDTMVLCVGKSTYARCFRGDTRVALIDGTEPTLEEMARRSEGGEVFWGYSLGPSGDVLVARLEAPRFVGRDALLEIRLEGGQVIRCTPDHVFPVGAGQLRAADDLRPGDSLVPLLRAGGRWGEQVFHPWNRQAVATASLARAWAGRNGFVLSDAQDREEAVRGAEDPVLSGLRHHGLGPPGVEAGAEQLAPGWATPGSSLSEESVPQRIRSIHGLPGTEDVFCLTVPEAGNFALASGVFTSNCGIIVNVTPLEPTWRGYLTLEISNTTPLPAKIYANEGIAQLIFFQSDEEPEVAYADRKGKYQDQHGVTLPKL
jgi:deoxycytidine triphosphate deaminase